MKNFDEEEFHKYVKKYNEVMPDDAQIEPGQATKVTELRESWEKMIVEDRCKAWRKLTRKEQYFFISLHSSEENDLYHMHNVMNPFIYPDIAISIELLNLPVDVRAHVQDNCRVINHGNFTITREELKTFYEGKDIIMVNPKTVCTDKGMLQLATQVAHSYLGYGWRGEDKTYGRISHENQDAKLLAESWGWKTIDEFFASNASDVMDVSNPQKKDEPQAMVEYQKSCLGKVYSF